MNTPSGEGANGLWRFPIPDYEERLARYQTITTMRADRKMSVRAIAAELNLHPSRVGQILKAGPPHRRVGRPYSEQRLEDLITRLERLRGDLRKVEDAGGPPEKVARLAGRIDELETRLLRALGQEAVT